MPDDLSAAKSNKELLKSSGFSSYEDLAAARLSGYFRPRNYTLPVWSEESVRRSLRQFESEITPRSRVISFLGAGHYDFGQTAHSRLLDLLPGELAADAQESRRLQEIYVSRAEALTGMRGVHPEAVTLHEVWMALIRWITTVRPGRCLVLVAESMDPAQKHQLRRLLPQFGLVYEELPTPDGVLNPALLLGSIHENTAAVLLSSPNYLGCFEAASEIGQIAHQRGALLGVVVDLLSLYLARTPEEYRANFCVANWQTLGVVPASAGSRSWLWAGHHLTSDNGIETAYPSSADLSATLGIARGLQDLTLPALQQRFVQTWSNAHFLREALGQMPECRLPHHHPFFREFVVRVPGVAEDFLTELQDQGLFAGISLSRDGFTRDWLLISASEQHLPTDLSYFLQAFKQALNRRSLKNGS